MKRDYLTGVAVGITFFVGTEVEHTPMYGEQTLFVVGLHDGDLIAELAEEHNCHHIYFGANQSFPNPTMNDAETWSAWERMIQPWLDRGYWCTLDLDVSAAEGLCEGSLCEGSRVRIEGLVGSFVKGSRPRGRAERRGEGNR